MNRGILLLMVITCIFIIGCGTDIVTEEDEYYEDMTTTYETFTITDLWEALETDDACNGTYILLQGVLFSVVDEVVILVDSDTSKTVQCEFTDDFDLSELETVLGNSEDGDEDIITIGGICRFYTDTTTYPYLDSCDYYYVNSDG